MSKLHFLHDTDQHHLVIHTKSPHWISVAGVIGTQFDPQNATDGVIETNLIKCYGMINNTIVGEGQVINVLTEHNEIVAIPVKSISHVTLRGC